MAESDGTLDGYREHQDFEGSFQGTAFGRYVTSTGNVEFVTETAPTPGKIADSAAA